MLKNLLAQIADDRIKAAYLPIKRFADVKADILRQWA